MRDISTPCQTDNGELWYSNEADDRAEAIEACRNCPLLEPCREIALPREQALTRFNRWGVWAGVDLEAWKWEPAVDATDAPQPGIPLHPDLPHDERATSQRSRMDAAS